MGETYTADMRLALRRLVKRPAVTLASMIVRVTMFPLLAVLLGCATFVAR